LDWLKDPERAKEPGGDWADAECLGGIGIADAGDGGGGVGAREGRRGRIGAGQGRWSIEWGTVEVSSVEAVERFL